MKTKTFNILCGMATSCGCYKKEEARLRMKGNTLSVRHGHWLGRHTTGTYNSWTNMKARCLNKNKDCFKNYGALGVTVCDRWMRFENFLSDMGYRPENQTIDRINPFGNYEPSNCRWATLIQQARNTRVSYERMKDRDVA